MIAKKVRYKKCRVCPERFEVNPNKPFVVWCSVDCAYKHQANLKAKKEKKDHIEAKKSITDWSDKLQDKVNAIARIIDRGLPCLAKGYHPNQIHAGHVFARGGNQSMRYNLHNIHRQSAQSNHFQNDDGLLREGLMREYGQGYLDFVSELRRTPALHYSNEEYHIFYRLACKVVNRMKKEDKYYSLKERVEMRNSINNELNIYDTIYSNYKLNN